MRERERESVCVCYKVAKAKGSEVRGKACDKGQCDLKGDARFMTEVK